MDRAAELVWVRETPFPDQSRSHKGPHVRRSHRKSKQGCGTCKARRVKCGEERPICSNCRHRNVKCDYLKSRDNYHVFKATCSTPPSGHSPPWTSTRDLSSEACLATHVFATSIARLADRSAASGTSSTSFVHILRHFEQSSYRTLSSITGQRILHDKILPMLMKHPFLLHTVLAYSSSHLQFLRCKDTDNSAINLTASYHTQRALNLYAACINTHKNDAGHAMLCSPTGLEEMDALFAACVCLTSLFYHVNEIDLPHSAWTVASSLPSNKHTKHLQCEAGIDWLTNISGLSTLLQLSQFQRQISQSCWYAFLIESNPTHQDMLPRTWTVDDRAENLQRRLEVYSCTDPSNIVPALLQLILAAPYPEYSTALSTLTPLLTLDPTNLSNFSSFISFPSKLSPTFISLLRQKPPDPIALLILGYWFGRMALVPHWWCKARGQGEAVAIAWYVEAIAYPINGTSAGLARQADTRHELLRNALMEFKAKSDVTIDKDCEVSLRRREELMWSHMQVVGSAWGRDAEVVHCGRLSDLGNCGVRLGGLKCE